MLRRWLKQRVGNWLYWVIRTAVADEMRQAFDEDASHIIRHIRRQASVESARFVLDHFELHQNAADRYVLMNECIKRIPAEGLILEFGVWRGNSIRNIAAQLPDRQVFGFDSFEGLTEPWVFAPAGEFADVERLPEVPSNVTLIKGMFQDTLPRFAQEHPGPIALLHVDSDLYSSCKFIFD